MKNRNMQNLVLSALFLALAFVLPFFTGQIPAIGKIPTALCVAAELCAYCAFAALFHKIRPKKRGFIYLSLVLSMLLGRLVWGGAMLLCTGIGGAFTLSAFWAGAVANALPGILAQLILIPPIVMLLSGAASHER